MERREAPGSLRDSLRPVCETSLCVVRGRTNPCEGPCASRRSIAARIVGGRTLLRHPTSRSTTPSVEQGTRAIRQNGRSAKSDTRVCKFLPSLCVDRCFRLWNAAAEKPLRQFDSDLGEGAVNQEVVSAV